VQVNKVQKRILFLVPDYYPVNGGYSNAIVNITSWLASTGRYEIHVFTRKQLEDNAELEIRNLVIHRMPPAKRVLKGLNRVINKVHEMRLLKQFFATKQFDFLLIETFEDADFSLKFLKHIKLPPNLIGVRIHGCTETEVFLSSKDKCYVKKFSYARKLSQKVNNIFSTTPYYISFFKTYYCNNDIGLLDKNFGLLPNFPPFALAGNRLPAREEIVLANEIINNVQREAKFSFLSLGRMNKYGYQQKNFELIAYAMKIIKSEAPDLYNKIKIILVGAGDYKNDFEGILQELGIKDKFIMFEQLPNSVIHMLQKQVRATILVSKFEGHSMFATEAMAFGSPLIVSKDSGVSELVENGQNGFQVDTDSPFELAEAIMNIVKMDYDSLRKKSLASYESRFSGQALIKAFDYYMETFPFTLKGRQ
jgi:glycosyltransferase involved in cell wall biosynthesis